MGSYIRMDPDQLTILMEKYLDGTLSGAEEQVLRDWYRNNEAGEVIWASDSPDERTRVQDRMLARLQKDIQQMGAPAKQVVVLRRRRTWMAAAAIGIVFLSGAAYLWPNPWSKRPVAAGASTITKALPVADLLPATNKATLLLSNGNTIVLDSVANGLLAQQGETRVKKTAQGQLIYQVATEKGSAGAGEGRREAAGGAAVPTAPEGRREILYNTILTPQGGTYTVTLSDGTRVWLNAGTSLKYPTAFTGSSRSVELKGEAYFEVAADAVRPFTVTGGGQTIRVLGTHFNINAYENEPVVRTTLLQGSVKVVRDGQEVFLRPGEQSLLTGAGSPGGTGTGSRQVTGTGSLRVTGAGSLRVKKDIDTAEVMAWKNGMFQFDEADIGTVMRQIGRWYNVEVIYNGTLPGDHFKGKIPRNVNASEALQILTLSGIQFKIDGRKIILN